MSELRINDPAVAPLVPVFVEMKFHADKKVAAVTILGWWRQPDLVRTYIGVMDLTRIVTRAPDASDAEWLRNIGARL